MIPSSLFTVSSMSFSLQKASTLTNIKDHSTTCLIPLSDKVDGLPRLHIYSFREHVTARLQDQFILAAWSQGAIFLKISSSLTCITGAVELFQKGEKASNPKQSILTSNLILYNLIKSYHSPRDRKQHKSLRQPPCCSRYFSDTLWALEVQKSGLPKDRFDS